MSNLIDFVDANMLLPEEPDPRYEDSPFKHIKQMHAKQKGKRFELISADIYKKLKYTVSKPVSTDHDRIINNNKVEVKGSTLAKGTEHFSFLQIRPQQDYDILAFVMFYPHELIIMEMDKATIKKMIEQNIFKKQHGGNKAESGTYCYYGNKETLKELGAKEIG